MGFGFDVGRYLGCAVRPEFVRDGGLREALGVAVTDWDPRVPELCASLAPVTAEIWLRTVVNGQPSDAVAQDLWR